MHNAHNSGILNLTPFICQLVHLPHIFGYTHIERSSIHNMCLENMMAWMFIKSNIVLKSLSPILFRPLLMRLNSIGRLFICVHCPSLCLYAIAKFNEQSTKWNGIACTVQSSWKSDRKQTKIGPNNDAERACKLPNLILKIQLNSNWAVVYMNVGMCVCLCVSNQRKMFNYTHWCLCSIDFDWFFRLTAMRICVRACQSEYNRMRFDF